MILPVTDDTRPNGSYETDDSMKLGVASMLKKAVPYGIRTRLHLPPQSPTRGVLVTDAGEPLRNLADGERLYILGHGEADKQGTLSGKSAEELLNHLIKRGLDITRSRKFVLVSCNAGVPIAGPSYAQQFYEALEKKLRWGFTDDEYTYRESNGFLPTYWVKAPRGLISFSRQDGKPEILPWGAYAEYRRLMDERDQLRRDERLQSARMDNARHAVEAAAARSWQRVADKLAATERAIEHLETVHKRVTTHQDWQFIPFSSAGYVWGLT